MGVVVTPVTSEVGIYPTIKEPRLLGIDNQALVASAQEASFWVLGEPSALMHTDGDIGSGRFFKEISFPNYTTVMEFRRHVRAVNVLVQYLGGDGWCGFWVGPALQVQVLDY